MTQLFKRVAALQVDTIAITDLRFSFSVERTLRPVPGKCEVKVWNLASTNRSRLESLTNAFVQLRAGYENSVSTLFQGNFRRISNTYEGIDWVTKISSEDGGARFRNARSNRSFRPGTPLSTVFQALATDLQVGQGNLQTMVQSAILGSIGQTFSSGTTLRGSTAEQLDELCRACGLEWSIQNNTLQILQRGQPLPGQAYLLSPDTGLVGSVTKEQRNRIKFKTLMIAGLEPGKLVQIRSANANGTYRINKCQYVGDSMGQEWNINNEASPVAAS